MSRPCDCPHLARALRGGLGVLEVQNGRESIRWRVAQAKREAAALGVALERDGPALAPYALGVLARQADGLAGELRDLAAWAEALARYDENGKHKES